MFTVATFGLGHSAPRQFKRANPLIDVAFALRLPAQHPQLLAEYCDTIEELAVRYPGKQRVAWVESLTASADLVFPTERARGATPDPDDEMFLECALAAEAAFIVSGDKRHLLALREFRGTMIVSCAAFLNLLQPGG